MYYIQMNLQNLIHFKLYHFYPSLPYESNSSVKEAN